jgi:BCD family chlorophyll transporter-like MFS transporter
VKHVSAFFKPLTWGLNQLAQAVMAVGEWARVWGESHPTTARWMGVFRLGLFQFGIGLSLAPITGTLNRVLIDELRIPAVAVALLISLHYFVSPIRAMVGYRSDVARSKGKWRTPFVVLGVMLTYGGLACAPFALILLGGNGVIPFWVAMLICMVIFLAYGAGINIVETVYLALVSDITPPNERGKVLSVLWGMLVLGTVVSAVIVSGLLVEYSHARLIRVMQGSAIVFVVLTFIALRRQERLRSDGTIIASEDISRIRLSLWESIRMLSGQKALMGLFGIIFVATMAFATHDVLLEPYGGQVLGMSVSDTMRLTALWGVTMVGGVGLAALLLRSKLSLTFLIGLGCTIGLFGFGVICYASDGALIGPFLLGVGMISLGRGVFLVGSIVLVMSLTDVNHAGLFLGIWGIVQAMGQGLGIISGGLIRDLVQYRTGNVVLGYTVVYSLSLVLLLGVVLALTLGLRKSLRVDEIKMPWNAGEEIPADQLVF